MERERQEDREGDIQRERDRQRQTEKERETERSRESERERKERHRARERDAGGQEGTAEVGLGRGGDQLLNPRLTTPNLGPSGWSVSPKVSA